MPRTANESSASLVPIDERADSRSQRLLLLLSREGVKEHRVYRRVMTFRCSTFQDKAEWIAVFEKHPCEHNALEG